MKARTAGYCQDGHDCFGRLQRGKVFQIGHCGVVQPFSQKSLTATVPKVFQIGLCGVVEAGLELFCNSWSAGFLGERL